MLLFDWKKIYETAQGDVYTCNLIMSMLIKGSVPKNVTNALFVGSTTELQKLIKKNKEKK